MTKIKLVMSGSGTLYPVYAGVVIRLAEAGYDIEAVCGVSSSAILAVAIGIGYKPNSELIKFVKQTLPIKHNVLKNRGLIYSKIGA